MPLLSKAVLMPVEGHDYSKPPTFIELGAGFPVNMSYFRGELRKSPGKSKYGSVAISGGQIMGLGVLELNTLSKYLVRTSKTKIQKFNPATTAWDSISDSDFGGGDDDFFSFANDTANGLLVITQYINVMRKWTGSGNTAALGGTPPRCKLVEYLSPYLLAGYIDDGIAVNPWKIQWPDTNDPETWSGGNSGSLLLSSDPSPLKQLRKLGNDVAAYKQNALCLLHKVDTADIFTPETIRVGIGLVAQNAVAVDEDGTHYFMSPYDIFRWNGGVPESIGKPLKEYLFPRLDRTNIGRCFAVTMKSLSEVWFFVVISGQSWPTEVWKYNYANGRWYMDTCDNITAAIAWQRTASETWDDEVGTWDDALDTWDEGVSTEASEEVIVGRDDGYTLKVDKDLAEDDGVAIDSQHDTKDYYGGTPDQEERFLEFDVEMKGPGYVYLYYSTDHGDTWVNIPYSSTQSYFETTESYARFKAYPDVWARHIRFRIRESTLSKTIYIRDFQPFFLPRGRKR